MFTSLSSGRRRSTAVSLLLVVAAATQTVDSRQRPPNETSLPALGGFDLQEATIAQIQQAIKAGQITTVGLVELYLKRIKAYNGTCVNEPQGILGPITTIPNAGQINALSTLNLRPAARKTWGFDDRKARSLTDRADDARTMPDALEVAAAQDRQFKQTGRLVGPLHGVVMAIKDQYDTFDMRTTSGADAQYANDRPPDDATFVKRLRDAGAIILAKANLAEYADRRRAQLVRRDVLQSVRHRARARHVERRLGDLRGRQPRDLRDRRGNRRVDSLAGGGQQPRRPRADAGTGEPRRHDGRGLEHAHRSDLPHRAGRREDPRRHRRLRSEGRDDRVQRRPQARRDRMPASPPRDGSTACASASSANT